MAIAVGALLGVDDVGAVLFADGDVGAFGLARGTGGAGGGNGYNKNKYVIQFEQYLSKTYSKKTVSNYVSIVDLFIRHHKEGRNPKVINIKSVVKYLNQISDTNTRKVTLSALKNFYTNIINQPSKLKFIKYGYKTMV